MAGIGWAPLGGEWWTWRWCIWSASPAVFLAWRVQAPIISTFLERTARTRLQSLPTKSLSRRGAELRSSRFVEQRGPALSQFFM
jgi:hypothetical protein